MASAHRRLPLVLALAATFSLPAQAQDPATDSLRLEIQRLQRQVEELRRTQERTTRQIMSLDERGAVPAGEAARAAQDTGRRTLPSGRGIYGKPFVRRFGAGTAVGGYFDMEYINEIDAHSSKFDQHRLIPFIFSEITDRLHFGTEIEFEHGVALEGSGGAARGQGAVKVEFATLDYTILDGLNVRSGLILSPLGRFNLVHDSPINDLTDRPLVDRLIIPTTLSEAGAGFFGTVYPTERALVTYELYLVNGFRDAIVGESGVRVRSGRGFGGRDNNFNKALVGRLAVSPFLGLELGASAHTGKYASRATRVIAGQSASFTGDERLTIAAVDATVQRGRFELLGEYATARADLPAVLTQAATGFTERQAGFYVQGNVHFGHGLIPPSRSSVFTGVTRYDRVDLSSGRTGDVQERLTLGLNWRPVEDAVVKLDFQWNWNAAAGVADRGNQQRRLLASMASYF